MGNAENVKNVAELAKAINDIEWAWRDYKSAIKLMQRVPQAGHFLDNAGQALLEHFQTAGLYGDEAAQAARGVLHHLDEIGSLVGDFATWTDDVVKAGAGAAKEFLSQSIPHFDEALQFSGAVFPVVGTMLAFWADNHSINEALKNIHGSYVEYCPGEYKVAATYVRHCREQQRGRDSNDEGVALSEEENNACDILFGIMERHGGAQLLARKINRNVGLAAGFAGPAAGLTVFGLTKLMEHGAGIPSLGRIDKVWVLYNLSGGPGTLLAGMVLGNAPGAMYGGAAWAGGNVALWRLRKNVEKWHDSLHTPRGRATFMRECGEVAEKNIKLDPTRFTEEAIAAKVLQRGEIAARHLGEGNYVPEDVYTLQRFGHQARMAVRYMGFGIASFDDLRGHGKLPRYLDRAILLMDFIKHSKVNENRDVLVEHSAELAERAKKSKA